MKYEAVFLLTLVFLVSGCLGQSPKDEISTGQFIGGNKGLEISYVEMPPKVFQNSTFDINLVVYNRGETNVAEENASFKLSNSKIFSLTEEDSTKSNKDRLDRVIEVGGYGGQTFIKFEDARYVSGVLTSESPIPLSVEACYPYRTLSTADICIARSEFSEVCSPAEIKDVQNSGAPIHVSEVEQILSIYTQQYIRVGVMITIESKGESTDRYFSSSDTTCQIQNSEYENEVMVSSIKIGSLSFDADEIKRSCNGNKIKLVDGKGKMQCNLAITDYVSGTGDYVERMTMEMNYLHTTLANSNIRVIPFSAE